MNKTALIDWFEICTQLQPLRWVYDKNIEYNLSVSQLWSCKNLIICNITKSDLYIYVYIYIYININKYI